MSLVFTSCKKDDEVVTAFDCLQTAEESSTLGTAYLADITNNANCVAYRDNLRELISEGCVTGTTATQLQVTIDALPCL